MRVWLRSIGLDRAIAYSILLKSWQTIAGLIGIGIIARNFSPEVQGYYYTFASLVGLQSFVELGLHLVISNFASHEWSRLRLERDGKIEGSNEAISRLVSLGRFVFKWYAVAAIVFLLLAGMGGYWFLGRANDHGVDWQMPWLLHILFSSIVLWCMPFLALLDGCDQVAQVARFRTAQAVAGNLAIWAAILAGTDLWAAPAYSLVSALFCLYYLLVSKRAFFKPFFEPPKFGRVSWRGEILPMQWRLALQGVTGYFVLSMFTPVMFYYHGPAVAGQMGMTWQIVGAIQSVSTIWVLTKAPKFGMLIAAREFAVLDTKWRTAAIVSMSLMVSGVLFVFVSVYYLRHNDWGPINRLLPPLPFLFLAGGAVLTQGVQCIAIYLRAHKREALMPVGRVTGVLMGLSVWRFGMDHGAQGATAAYLLVMSCVSFPMAALIWRESRRDWHR